MTRAILALALWAIGRHAPDVRYAFLGSRSDCAGMVEHRDSDVREADSDKTAGLPFCTAKLPKGRGTTICRVKLAPRTARGAGQEDLHNPAAMKCHARSAFN